MGTTLSEKPERETTPGKSQGTEEKGSQNVQASRVSPETKPFFEDTSKSGMTELNTNGLGGRQAGAAEAPENPSRAFTDALVSQVMDKTVSKYASTFKEVLEAKNGEEVVGVATKKVVTEVLEQAIPGLDVAGLVLTATETGPGDDQSSWYRKQLETQIRKVMDANTKACAPK